MSDEEQEYRETQQKKAPIHVDEGPQKTEAELLLEEKMKRKNEEDDEKWKEYIDSWRKQRTREEEELRKLKEKQSKRKHQRAEEERKLMEHKRKQEEQSAKEKEEKRQKELEEKRRRLEEAEKRRQAMLKQVHHTEEVKPNFVIQKRTDGGPGASLGGTAMDKMMNVAAARGEMGKTKEQLADDKKIALTFRVKPLEIEGLSVEDLKVKAKELWENIVKLETDKYDLEERQKRQEYDLKELNERQRQINRNKALKKGLDPEALSGRYPPKIQVASKYERRIDRRTYGDKKTLYNGGYESFVVNTQEKTWTDRTQAFEDKKGRLPKWLGEQPGKKPGDPEDEEEEKKATSQSHADEAEEEEEEVEEDEEEDEEEEEEEE
ncbi:hypothetical protein CHUAL_009170 [Chamberlinius hualienensis]